MTEELINELSKRIAGILASHESSLSDGFTWYGGRSDDAIEIADTRVPLPVCRELSREVLRLMRWARASAPADRSFEMPWHPEPVLTLPPDDWKPTQSNEDRP